MVKWFYWFNESAKPRSVVCKSSARHCDSSKTAAVYVPLILERFSTVINFTVVTSAIRLIISLIFSYKRLEIFKMNGILDQLRYFICLTHGGVITRNDLPCKSKHTNT